MDVRMIAHDMRTPLNALLLSTQMAQAVANGDEELMASLRSIERNARALSGMIDSLLVTSEHGPWSKGELELRECLPLDLVAGAIDQVAPLAAAKSQILKSGELLAIPTIVADGERLIRVLVNLLSNAIKFTAEGGEIEIDAKASANGGQDCVVFTVSDNGIGVSAENVHRIFSEGVSIAKPGSYSSGLGLAVCKELVEAQGGRIWVEEGRKKGSAFSFAVPVHHSAAAHPVTPAS